MSLWRLGADDLSEEQQDFKTKLSSQDTKIAAQQSQIFKQSAELDELRATLNDTLHKLNHETTRALQLEAELSKCSDDLQNEKVASQNHQTALVASQEKLKAKELETRELEAILESISHTSDGHNSRSAKLEKEKGVLEVRVKELETNLRLLSSPPVTPGRLRTPAPARPRSSSVSNPRITSLENEMSEVRGTLSQKEAELRAKDQKLASVQDELLKVDNDKVALEKRMKKELDEMTALIEEKEEEMEYLRSTQGDGAREEELLRRIEEDDAKIEALEMLLGDAQEVNSLKERLKRTEERLRAEVERASEEEARNVDLVHEKEDALDELADARAEIASLSRLAEDSKTRLEALSRNQLPTPSVVIHAPEEDSDAHRSPPYATDANSNTVTHIERLLAAIERLRNERDTLRRDLQFVQTESQFTIEALENRITNIASQPAPVPTDDHEQRDAELEATYVQLKSKDLEVKRLNVGITAAAIAIRHFYSQVCSQDQDTEALQRVDEKLKDVELKLATTVQSLAETSTQRNDLMSQLECKDAEWAAEFEEIRTAHQATNDDLESMRARLSDVSQCLAEAESQRDSLSLKVGSQDQEDVEALRRVDEKLKDVELKLAVTVQCLEETTHHRDELLSQIDTKEGEWAAELEELKNVHKDTKDNLERMHEQLSEVSNALEATESQRDSLSLQVTNLSSDLAAAQQELTDAETRYSTLQFHQLSTMSSNEATRVLKEQIEELEMRVMRRTEQIGIHQHDIKRMETNLRLQEERLSEMTAEMETLAEQKEAMVEDCADAREARDDAIVRVEGMEVEMEVLEGRLQESEVAVTALVEVIMQTVANARQSSRKSHERAHQADEDIRRLNAEHQGTAQTLQQNTSQLVELRQILEISGNDARQAALALAVSQIDLKKSLLSNQALSTTSADLTQQVEELQTRLDAQYTETKALMAQLDSAREEATGSQARTSEEVILLETKVHDFENTIKRMQEEHDAAVDQLQNSINEKDRSLAENDVEGELVQLKFKHIEELGALQSRLVETSSALEEAQMRLSAVEESYHASTSESTRLKQELEAHLENASEASQIHAELGEELKQTREQHVAEIKGLRQHLATAESDLRAARESQERFQGLHLQSTDDLVRLREEQGARILELSDNVGELQSKLAEYTQNLAQSEEEVDRLRDALQQEVEGRHGDHKAYEHERQTLSERCSHAEAVLTTAKDDLVTTQAQLEETQNELESIHDEKTTLQQNITAIESEYQRSISLTRFLESQIKDGEQAIASLSADLERINDALAHAERAGKTAEVNLSLQGAQHKREMSQIQRELAMLKSRPNLENALAELEDRNNEMEDLLRDKCREIEENDDRALEMLKENKKLTAKVESLSRKVQNLQTKLVAAKAANPTTKASPEIEAGPSRLRSNTLSSIPQMPVIPAQSDSTPIARSSSTRVVSVPSSLPRPKTPERRRPVSVFKALSPDKRASIVDPSPVTSMAGKKRPIEDDYLPIGPHGFSAECVPRDDVEPIVEAPSEPTTPRVRRVLSSIQSGFTPVRHQNKRPIAPLPSPRRSDLAFMKSPPADVNNDSHASLPIIASGEKSSKRSWLGKIRGVSTTLPGGRTILPGRD